jgi:hypothetical protein
MCTIQTRPLLTSQIKSPNISRNFNSITDEESVYSVRRAGLFSGINGNGSGCHSERSAESRMNLERRERFLAALEMTSLISYEVFFTTLVVANGISGDGWRASELVFGALGVGSSRPPRRPRRGFNVETSGGLFRLFRRQPGWRRRSAAGNGQKFCC